MKFKWFLIVLCCAGLLHAQIPSETAAKKTTAPIVLDGRLDEADWRNAPGLSDFKIEHVKGNLPSRTRVSVLYDDANLYVGFRCEMKPGVKLKTQVRQRDYLRIFYDESVEFMLDPGATRDKYYQFIVNASGSLFDSQREQGGFVQNFRWNSDASAATFIGKDFWSCELKMPFHSLDIPPGAGSRWAFNAGRNFRDGTPSSNPWGNLKVSASLTSSGAFHTAGLFPVLKELNVDFSKYGIDPDVPEVIVGKKKNAYSVTVGQTLHNRENKPQKCRVEMTLKQKGVSCLETRNIILCGNGKQTVSFDFEVPELGDAMLRFEVKDPASGQLLKCREFPVKLEYAPLSIVLEVPYYRDSIFASQELKSVRCSIRSILSDVRYRTFIRDGNGKVLCEKELDAPGCVEFAAEPLPEGKMRIVVEALDKTGKVVASAVHPLRKLPRRKGEVWRGKDDQWYVDGKKFFVIAAWTPSSEHVPGVNVTTYPHPDTRRLATQFMTRKFTRGGITKRRILTKKDEELVRSLVRQTKNDPKLFAYYLMDEPEIQGCLPRTLAKIADIMRDEDPYHPIMVSGLGSRDFADVAELNALHAYPRVDKYRPKANFDKVVVYMKIATDLYESVPHGQTILYMQQGFNYGDFSIPNIRVPSFDELRSEYLLAVILGAKGITFYNRQSRHYPEIGLGAAAFAKELNVYAQVLLEKEARDASMSCSGKQMYWTVRRHGDQIWIFAVSTHPAAQRAEFRIPASGNRPLQVVCEGRRLPVGKGAFSDVFERFQVHVYTTDLHRFDIPSMAETEAKIKARNEARRKKGNLAFQMFEGDSVDVTASSNKSMIYRPENCLWHVTDGVTLHNTKYDGDKLLWANALKTKPPHWIELDFRKEITIGRVKVYPLNKTLKNFEIQVRRGGQWKPVASVRDGKEDCFELHFPPVKTQKLRLYVTFVNGPEVRIKEIEVYAK